MEAWIELVLGMLWTFDSLISIGLYPSVKWMFDAIHAIEDRNSPNKKIMDLVFLCRIIVTLLSSTLQ